MNVNRGYPMIAEIKSPPAARIGGGALGTEAYETVWPSNLGDLVSAGLLELYSDHSLFLPAGSTTRLSIDPHAVGSLVGNKIDVGADGLLSEEYETTVSLEGDVTALLLQSLQFGIDMLLTVRKMPKQGRSRPVWSARGTAIGSTRNDIQDLTSLRDIGKVLKSIQSNVSRCTMSFLPILAPITMIITAAAVLHNYARMAADPFVDSITVRRKQSSVGIDLADGFPADISAAAVTAGRHHSCALTAGSRPNVVCWGDDTYGQASPPTSKTTYTQISAGAYHTCAITTGKTIRCWGWDQHGQSSPRLPRPPTPRSRPAPTTPVP